MHRHERAARVSGGGPARTRSVVVTDLWYKDAVIYELDVRTYQDGNGDGIGDFRGLLQRLPLLSGFHWTGAASPDTFLVCRARQLSWGGTGSMTAPRARQQPTARLTRRQLLH